MQVQANGLRIEVDVQGAADGAPLLLMGPMLASNKMLAQAIGQAADAPNHERPNA